jgi:hypothetical protein
LNNTNDQLYKEELEDLNVQLSNMVKKSEKKESINEYGILLHDTAELDKMVKEIVRANKKTIS